jgi:ketosteroid isomerase-like protein
MDPRLQKLLDEQAIRRLLADYAHGCDRCDEALMAGVYADDSWDDHGHVKARGEDFARIMTGDLIPRTTRSLSHLLGQSLIEIDGDEARAETYFIAVTLSESDGTPMCNQLGGRYADQLRREGDAWKIVKRTAIRDWSISLRVEADSFAAAQLIPGARSAADPGVAVIGRAHRNPQGA